MPSTARALAGKSGQLGTSILKRRRSQAARPSSVRSRTTPRCQPDIQSASSLASSSRAEGRASFFSLRRRALAPLDRALGARGRATLRAIRRGARSRAPGLAARFNSERTRRSSAAVISAQDSLPTARRWISRRASSSRPRYLARAWTRPQAWRHSAERAALTGSPRRPGGRPDRRRHVPARLPARHVPARLPARHCGGRGACRCA